MTPETQGTSTSELGQGGEFSDAMIAIVMPSYGFDMMTSCKYKIDYNT